MPTTIDREKNTLSTLSETSKQPSKLHPEILVDCIENENGEAGGPSQISYHISKQQPMDWNRNKYSSIMNRQPFIEEENEEVVVNETSPLLIPEPNHPFDHPSDHPQPHPHAHSASIHSHSYNSYQSHLLSTSSKQRFIIPVLTEIAQSIPAVGLGLILNLLDALSYGIIIFPTNDTFMPKSSTQSGISMFLVSTIISQLVYSIGGR